MFIFSHFSFFCLFLIIKLMFNYLKIFVTFLTDLESLGLSVVITSIHRNLISHLLIVYITENCLETHKFIAHVNYILSYVILIYHCLRRLVS